MSEFYKQLKKAMELNHISQMELCKKTNIPKSAMSQYISGKFKPKQNRTYLIAKALNVNEAWLMGFDDVPMERIDDRDRIDIDLTSIPNIEPLPKMKKVPLLGTIACGEPILAEENIEDYINMPEDTNGTFALRCKGDSMINARIFDGDIVYIKEEQQVNNGEIAAVLIENEATLKRVYYYPEKNMLILKAENSKYNDFVFTDNELNDIKIIGKAVGFYSRVI